MECGNPGLDLWVTWLLRTPGGRVLPAFLVCMTHGGLAAVAHRAPVLKALLPLLAEEGLGDSVRGPRDARSLLAPKSPRRRVAKTAPRATSKRLCLNSADRTRLKWTLGFQWFISHRNGEPPAREVLRCRSSGGSSLARPPWTAWRRWAGGASSGWV